MNTTPSDDGGLFQSPEQKINKYTNVTAPPAMLHRQLFENQYFKTTPAEDY